MSSSWQGDEFFEEVRGQIRANIGTAAEVLKADIQENIGIQGVPEARRSYRGEFPRMETGDLQRSIQVSGPTESNDTITAKVGSNLPYAQVLEEEMDRSFLARTLHENEDNYAQIIIGGEE